MTSNLKTDKYKFGGRQTERSTQGDAQGQAHLQLAKGKRTRRKIAKELVLLNAQIKFNRTRNEEKH
jgi:hypothetical protein